MSKQKPISSKHIEKPTFIVAIGASAGGLEAIQAFFDHMHSNEDLVFIVVQHLSPDFKSLMDQLLKRNTEMNISVVEDGMDLKANTVFLIPPGHNITLKSGKFVLTEQERGHFLNLPIDILFKSMAQEYGSSGIAIVLSGTGSDGSRGIIDVAESGGLTITQTPGTAQFDGMPKNAIGTDSVQCVCDVPMMANIISKYIDDPNDFIQKKEKQLIIPGDGYEKIFNLLKSKYRVDYNDYKPTTISRRIDRRIQTLSLNSFEEYIDYLLGDAEELDTLHRDLLIGVTSFFRDKPAFEQLQKNAIPLLIKKYQETGDAIRIWVPACSTGQEVFSIIISVMECARKMGVSIDMKIFATDISSDFLEIANRGVYSDTELENVPNDILKRYFQPCSAGSYQIIPAIRNCVVFSPHNLITDPPFTRMDLISCRNFLIYIKPNIQSKIVNFFKYALAKDGFLFLGSSESFDDDTGDFAIVDNKSKIFQKLRHTRIRNDNTAMPFPLQQSIMAKSHGMMEDKLVVPISLNMYHDALNHFVKCGYLIDADKNLIHIFGSGGDFLHIASGAIAHLDITTAVWSELKAPLKMAFHKAKSTEHYTEYACQIHDSENQSKEIILGVHPLLNNAASERYFLVTVDKNTNKQDTKTIQYNPDEHTHQVVSELERELQETRESLQVTIEEVETTNEELQSTNEELLASNEELQSTNEELHSVNEELYTVNAEFQTKIDELSTANNDIDNILRSTNIGAIFVDTKLNIRFFTPSIAPVYSLLPTDIGRSINSFKHILDMESIAEHFKSVISSGKIFQKEVSSHKGKWYQVKVLPYINDASKIDGAILTVFDVTETKLATARLREADERLNLAIKNSDIATWTWLYDQDLLRVDDNFLRIFCIEDGNHELIVNDFLKIVSSEFRQKIKIALESAVSSNIEFKEDFEIVRSDKERRKIAARGRVCKNSLTSKPFITGVCWDITERVHLEDLAIESEGRKVAMDDITDGWWDWNLETNEEYLSPKFKEMFGYADDEMENSTDAWMKITYPEDLELVLKNYHKHIESDGKHPYHQEVRFHHKDGHTVWVICRGKALKNKAGKFVRMIGTHTDITQAKQYESTLNTLALKDTLTMLPNRNNFLEYLPKVIQRAGRRNSMAALFYIDLDNFKQVNDSLGHPVGDQLLIEASKRLQEISREIDYVARLGGDEFAVVIEGIESSSDSGILARRVLEAFQKPIQVQGHDVITTLSIGIAMYPEGGQTTEELLQHADAAMYQSKSNGKNNFCFYNTLINKKVQRQHQLEIGMYKALESDEFTMVYQPQLDIATGKIDGLEALIRWPNEALQKPAPSEFIPIAESGQLIKLVGNWTFRASMAAARQLCKKHESMKLSINLSPIQASAPQFPEQFLSILEEFELPTKHIILELTETNLIQHINKVQATMKYLGKRGIHFALDDFGTGYSSMQHLKHLPISQLKIDQSFIKDIGKDKSDEAIISATISLATKLGISTVAEGVETPAQLDFLKKEGCTHIQGYLIAKPMPLQDLEAFLAEHE